MKNSTQESHHLSNNLVTYDSPYSLYAMSISLSSSATGRRSTDQFIAVGSFIEDYNNRIDILNFDNETLTLTLAPNLSFGHPYPPTKLMFQPSSSSSSLLASSADFLRIYSLKNDSSEQVSVLNNSKSSDFCAPLTSFDCNDFVPQRIETSSINTTYTIWDIEKSVVLPMIKKFTTLRGGRLVFLPPLLRLAWNKQDLRYMATVLMDSNKVVILDIRSPTMPVAELERRHASVNAVAWAPQSGWHICSAGDDAQALIWELPQVLTIGGINAIDHLSTYNAGSEINQLQ